MFRTYCMYMFFFFSSRRRHTIFDCDWSSDVCSSDLRGDARIQHLLLSGLLLGGELARVAPGPFRAHAGVEDRKSTRLNSSHSQISYAVFCLKKKKTQNTGKRSKAPRWRYLTTSTPLR